MRSGGSAHCFPDRGMHAFQVLPEACLRRVTNLHATSAHLFEPNFYTAIGKIAPSALVDQRCAARARGPLRVGKQDPLPAKTVNTGAAS